MASEDTPTPKKGKGRVILHPLKFEDALKGLLGTKRLDPKESDDESFEWSAEQGPEEAPHRDPWAEPDKND